MKPELLAPAGNLEKLKTAFEYGADACYMGVKSMSMRVRENEVGQDDVREALRIAKKLGKKLYLTMNIHAHETRLSFLSGEIKYLQALHREKLDPDAILVSDAGVLMRLQQECPWIKIHISTQANVLNSEAVAFWAAQPNVTRVVLARETSLREVKKIRAALRKKKIKIELEAFVHGAMCMAYSGRCLLSSFMASRDANEGMCAHSCRWNYKILEEGLRPGEYIPMEEDDKGTYIMSSKDMCMVEHLKELMDAGVDSLKIEGRHKTIYYVAVATRAYREALDLAAKGKKPTREILELVESINTRGYFTGFWYGQPGAEGQKYKDRSDYNDRFCFAGVARRVDGNRVTMEVKNTLREGDKLTVITPRKNTHFILKDFCNARTGEAIKIAHAGQGFCIQFPLQKLPHPGLVLRLNFPLNLPL